MLSDSPKRKLTICLTSRRVPRTSINNKRKTKIHHSNCIKPQQKISEFSGLAVYRALNVISKEVVSISTLRYGNFLMLVKTKNVAEKLKSKNLARICEIDCILHESLNFVKGTIYAPFLINVPDDEIVKELADQHVHSLGK